MKALEKDKVNPPMFSTAAHRLATSLTDLLGSIATDLPGDPNGTGLGAQSELPEQSRSAAGLTSLDAPKEAAEGEKRERVQ